MRVRRNKTILRILILFPFLFFIYHHLEAIIVRLSPGCVSEAVHNQAKGEKRVFRKVVEAFTHHATRAALRVIICVAIIAAWAARPMLGKGVPDWDPSPYIPSSGLVWLYPAWSTVL